MNWSFLEALPGLIAVPSIWSQYLGAAYQPFRTLCLQPDDWWVESYPCLHKCGCWHTVIPRPDRTGATATCCCNLPLPFHTPSPNQNSKIENQKSETTPCPDLILSPSDVTPLKLNWQKLARHLCRAFEIPTKFAELAPSNTCQIGAWSADAVPVILTIQNEYEEPTNVIAELAIRLQKPFILLAPTANLLTPDSDELLTHARAGFFPLDTTVTLTPDGRLISPKPPGMLFARFTPQPKETDMDTATRVIALVSQFDSDTLAVFRLYCIDGLSASQSARQLRCSKTTVMRRLNIIRQKTGLAPSQMRRLSPHLAQMEDNLSDPRARRIHRDPNE